MLSSNNLEIWGYQVPGYNSAADKVIDYVDTWILKKNAIEYCIFAREKKLAIILFVFIANNIEIKSFAIPNPLYVRDFC